MSTFGIFAILVAIVGICIIGFVLYKSHILLPRKILSDDLLKEFKSYRSDDK
jgi:hypothetical protein